MAAGADCGVCCETFTLVTRKKVECGWCDFLVCSSCVQRFLLDLSDTPQCMNCKHQWDREFLESKFTKTFINGTLKKHREEVLFEVEKGLLPETQPYAEAAKCTAGIETQRKKFNAEQAILKKQFAGIPRLPFTDDNLKQRHDIDKKLAIIKVELKYLTELKHLAHTRHYNMDNQARPGTSARPEQVERRAFIKPCPSPECRGFLSTGWKCGLCNVKVCSKCHEVKSTPDADEGEQHICKPENLATVEALAKDSKPCPKCGAMIQRIEGCSQMFHTPLSGGCGAIFDWNTLRIHTDGDGTVHNPHWYEWQRHINGGNVPRQLGDVPMFCGGLPLLRNLTNTVYTVIKDSVQWGTVTNQLTAIHQAYNHNQYTVIPQYRVNMVGDNRDLRIKYLLQDITEKRFKQLIQQREKARIKKLHMTQVLTMYQAAVADTLTRACAARTDIELIGIVDELTALIEYTNESFGKVSQIYDCVKPFVSSGTYKIDTREPKPAASEAQAH